MENNIEKQLDELIDSVNEYINKIPYGSVKIAEFLRNGSSDEAFRFINDFIEGIDWLISAINILKSYNTLIYFSKSGLNNLLLEINDAIKNKNEILLADLFEYEVADFFESKNNIKINRI